MLEKSALEWIPEDNLIINSFYYDIIYYSSMENVIRLFFDLKYKSSLGSKLIGIKRVSDLSLVIYEEFNSARFHSTFYRYTLRIVDSEKYLGNIK